MPQSSANNFNIKPPQLKSIVVSIIALSVLNSCATAPAGVEQLSKTKPNILYIIADDLGYSDIAAFGGEIATPNLDALLKTGRVLTNYHTSTVCAVTRSMLYSGTDHHLVGEGTMGEPKDERKGLPGYEGYLNNHALSVAELLKDNGYHTYIAGKWHLGSKINSSEDKTPDQWGFERSFTLLGGATKNHFSHDLAADKTYTENGQFVSIPATDANGQPWYDSNVYAQKLISYIDENIADNKPFAAFATFTNPHWPLQVPEPWLSQYKGKYDGGYEQIRNQRLQRQKQLGLLPADSNVAGRLPNTLAAAPASANFGKPNASYINADTVQQGRVENVDYGPGRVNPDWNSLTPDQKKLQARYMEIYAGMVSNLDYNIGLLIQHLKDIGQYENTFIIFHSDNGAEGRPNTSAQDAINLKYFDYLGQDSELATKDKASPYIQYGARWGEVSATPFRSVKSYTTEGGTSVPTIVHLPGQTQQYATLHDFAHVRDATPTLLELAGIPQPTQPANATGVNGLPLVSYKDRAVYPITGRSFLGALKNETTGTLHPEPVGEEQYGRAYLRSGPWKLLWTEPPTGPADGHWQLYNIDTDRAESNDLAASKPEKVAELYQLWREYLYNTGGVEPKRPGNAGPVNQ